MLHRFYDELERGTVKSQQDMFDTVEGYAEAFGHLPPADIWPPASQRFGVDLHARWVNLDRHWILRRPAFSRRLRTAACSLAPLGGPLGSGYPIRLRGVRTVGAGSRNWSRYYVHAQLSSTSYRNGSSPISISSAHWWHMFTNTPSDCSAFLSQHLSYGVLGAAGNMAKPEKVF